MFTNRTGGIWDSWSWFWSFIIHFQRIMADSENVEHRQVTVTASADFHLPPLLLLLGRTQVIWRLECAEGRVQLCSWLKRKQVPSTQWILKTIGRTHLLTQRQRWVLGERGFLIYLSCFTVLEAIKKIKLAVLMTPLCLIKLKLRDHLYKIEFWNINGT